jgi:hypothetical protein
MKEADRSNNINQLCCHSQIKSMATLTTKHFRGWQWQLIKCSFHATQDTWGSNTWACQQNPGLLQPATSKTDNPWRQVATGTD